MGTQEKFGDRLNYLRLKEDKSLSDIASLLALTDDDIARLESGALDVSLDYLVKLAAYFQVSTDFLLGLTDLPFLEHGASD